MLAKAPSWLTPLDRHASKQPPWRRIGTVAAVFMLGLAALIAAPPARAATYSVVYSFNGLRGSKPAANLLDVGGTLYGTTEYGGTSKAGTVFALRPGVETVLHSFANSASDGDVPAAGLIAVGGKLYGTTSQGGPSGGGTIFSIDPTTLQESVVYAFQSQADGLFPLAGLIDVNGVLYGTTSIGGAGTCNCGTVFSFNLATGAKTTVYSFLGGLDGANPHAGLLRVGGKLYGTTQGGGGANDGTVFALDSATRAETVVHEFLGNTDGADPVAALIEVGSMLYGTTSAGGVCEMTGGCGTVFSLNPATGAEQVVYAFKIGNDGIYPAAPLLDVHGVLYGTTQAGGLSTCEFYGCGTVFALDPATGTESLVHIFQAGSDGSEPTAGLIDVNGTLFGTTPGGGNRNDGTVFSYQP
jgi:uncharacterized repeat protein (TIGR03803 family)